MSSFTNQLNIIETLNFLDWFIFVLVLLVTLISVLYGELLKKKNLSRSNEKESFLDLLIMGRQLTLPMFIATLVATWYGGIFGVTEIAFNKGIYNFITQGVFWYVAYIIFAFFIINKISSFHAVTLPNLVTQMFGTKAGYLSALFNFFNVLPIAYAISLGIFLQAIFGGNLYVMIAIGLTFVILYSMWGGLRAVVFSDLIQFVVMCSAVFLVLLFSLIFIGSPQFLMENLPPQHFSLTGGESLATTLVWGFIALSTLVDPNFYQRCFAAKSSNVAKRGILISTFIWFCFDICTTFGAMYARAVIPQAQASHAYLFYSLQILPVGLKGFFLAGILATILSTLDSYLFLAGTTLAYDLAPKKWKGKVLIHHIGIIAVGIISFFLAIIFDGNIKSVWKTLGSYSASCLLIPILYGYLFPGKIRDNQFVFSCLFGVIATTIWRSIERTGFIAEIDALYIGVLSTSGGLLLWSFIPRKIKS